MSPMKTPVHPSGSKHLVIASASIGIALAVMGIKYIAFLMTGSVALFSDALESIVNVLTAVAALIAIRIGLQPPDRGHPFGHHKAEYFVGGTRGRADHRRRPAYLPRGLPGLPRAAHAHRSGGRLAGERPGDGDQRRLGIRAHQPR